MYTLRTLLFQLEDRRAQDDARYCASGSEAEAEASFRFLSAKGPMLQHLILKGKHFNKPSFIPFTYTDKGYGLQEGTLVNVACLTV